ncbi:hypothetical protein CHY_2525 [Carboxydothermus hydrogenoformans Z-2901]|uniref:Uncharacterized protein n=1 Tax=Carboxydothermus hydrogenoformans (strain ATCC BAA-161 / DSM 6008 / Z-2901) TaxID=246194 RepID=Q3A966_CARHZ|nr:hypothetical protein CHY_2525 [Carboxydothermus hydrogenoformans Z-2901]
MRGGKDREREDQLNIPFWFQKWVYAQNKFFKEGKFRRWQN